MGPWGVTDWYSVSWLACTITLPAHLTNKCLALLYTVLVVQSYGPVMWSICYSYVSNMLQSCDQYAPVMWSICTSHVSNVYKSRDQYATVMRSMCTSHVINMCYLATAWKYLVKAWALVKTICSQSQNLWLVNITFDRPFPKILWFLLFGGHLNQIVITILIVSIHFWYQLQHFFRIMSH